MSIKKILTVSTLHLPFSLRDFSVWPSYREASLLVNSADNSLALMSLAYNKAGSDLPLPLAKIVAYARTHECHYILWTSERDKVIQEIPIYLEYLPK